MNEETNPPALRAAQFRWAVGLESSTIPHLNIDQYEWTQHSRFWREDFKRAADLGCRWLRYSLPWSVCEPSRGQWNWHWAEERLGLCRDLGLNVILDLVHFGVPSWLPESFGDIDFPSALEAFAAEAARRLSGLFYSFCPVNEPLITALFCGDVGLWPPHGRGLRCYMTLLSRVAQGLARAARAAKAESPKNEIIVCDAAETATIASDAGGGADWLPAAQLDLALRLDRRHIVIDLIRGRVDDQHPLRSWLESHGFPEWDLRWFRRHPAPVDVLGLDYYCHSEMELYPHQGRVRQRMASQPAGLDGIVADYWKKHQLPIMITETSVCGPDDRRCEWLQKTLRSVRALREKGIPVIGYTWWPLVDHLDWDGAMLHRVGKIHRVGIFRLERQPSGELTRRPTALTDLYRQFIQQGDAAVGALTPAPQTSPQLLTHLTMTTTMPSKNSASKPDDFPIIVHSHLPWSGVWQRPQQIMSRLARRHPIIFLEGPRLTGDDTEPRSEVERLPRHPAITVMRTHFPRRRFSDGAWVDQWRLNLLQQELAARFPGQFDRAVHWFYDPMAAPCFIGNLDMQAVVYDCMDELSQFRFAPPEIRVRERQLLAAAHVVFCGGRKLHQSKSRFNRNAHFYGCGVEFEHFNKAQAAALPAPSDVAFIAPPVLGYFGVVDERLDYALVDRLAAADPHWNVVMIGPTAKIDPDHLPCRPNLFWVGRREYEALPDYARVFSACLMPFALNESTEFINPTKALEYLATGRPVISTAVPDVIANFGHVVKIAPSPEAFISLCQLAVSSPQQFDLAGGLQLARQNTWDEIVHKMENHIHCVLQKNQSPGIRASWAAPETQLNTETNGRKACTTI